MPTDPLPALPLVLAELRRTCEADPSRWEARTTGGVPVHVDFDRGYLSVRLGLPGGTALSALSGEEILGAEHDGRGRLSDAKMRFLTRDVLEIPDALLAP